MRSITKPNPQTHLHPCQAITWALVVVVAGVAAVVAALLLFVCSASRVKYVIKYENILSFCMHQLVVIKLHIVCNLYAMDATLES